MVQEHQPHATNNMSQKPAESLALKYSEGAATQAGKETVKYLSDPNQRQQLESEAQQKYSNAQAQAEGMWAKYCGCFSS